MTKRREKYKGWEIVASSHAQNVKGEGKYVGMAQAYFEEVEGSHVVALLEFDSPPQDTREKALKDVVVIAKQGIDRDGRTRSLRDALREAEAAVERYGYYHDNSAKSMAKKAVEKTMNANKRAIDSDLVQELKEAKQELKQLEREKAKLARTNYDEKQMADVVQRIDEAEKLVRDLEYDIEQSDRSAAVEAGMRRLEQKTLGLPSVRDTAQGTKADKVRIENVKDIIGSAMDSASSAQSARDLKVVSYKLRMALKAAETALEQYGTE